MSAPPREPRFWSPCCGQPAGYAGYYRCTGCGNPVNIGQLVTTADEAARIRAEAGSEAPA